MTRHRVGARVCASRMSDLDPGIAGCRTRAYPALEVAHIVGIALLLGNLVALELRVWGAAAELPVRPLARLSLTLSRGRLRAASRPAALAMFAAAGRRAARPTGRS